MKRLVMMLVATGVCTWALAAMPGKPLKSAQPAKPRVTSKSSAARAGAQSRTTSKPAEPGAASRPADPYGPVVPTTQPDLSKLPRTLMPWNGVDTKAVQIVKRVYNSTRWLGQVKSFRIEARSTILPLTAEQTARKNKSLALTREHGMRPAPPMASVYRSEFAFEDRRIHYLHEPVDSNLGSRTLRIWDGKTACLYDLDLRTGSEGYGLEAKLDRVGSRYNGAWWPPAAWPGRFRYWFDVKPTPDYYDWLNTGNWHPARRLLWDDKRDRYPWAVRPEDYHVVGTQEYRGVRCHVLEQRPAQLGAWRLYVGVETGLLHGQLTGDALEDPIYGHSDPREQEIYDAVGYSAQKRRAIAKVSSSAPLESNLAARTRSHHEEIRMGDLYHAELHRRGFETEAALRHTTGLPTREMWYGDFKEIAPGCFWPMKCGQIGYALDVKGRLVGTPTQVIEIQKVEVNADLPDELFTIEIKEGVHVNDRRYDPPLSYTYRSDMPDEPTLAAWRQEKEKLDVTTRQRKAALDSLIGRPAPELPAVKWYNSKPLTWKDLRGKTVIVSFPGDGCIKGEEMRLLSALHEHLSRSGLHVIAIHAATTPRWHVEGMVPWGNDKYPFCQDAPGLNPANGGATYERYQIATGPYAFVVGPDGNVVRHGLLPELPEVKAYCESLPPLRGHEDWSDDLAEASGGTTTAPGVAER